MKKWFAVIIVVLTLFVFGCSFDGTLGFCAFPDCPNLAIDDSDFCSEHQQQEATPVEQTCREFGCYNTPLSGGYCSEHACLQSGCTNPRNSEFYCKQHGG